MDLLCGYEEEELRLLLCYPLPTEECFVRRLVEAKLLGVRCFLRGGRHVIRGIPVVGKGTTAIVLAAEHLGGLKAAVKVRRLDANRVTLLGEARMLRLANRYGVGPPLLAASRNMVVWKLVEGEPFYRWLEKTEDPQEIKEVLRKIVFQLYSLDEAGIAHNELSRPGEHILVEGRTPYILDFESATFNRSRSNLTQFLSILAREGVLSTKLRETLGLDKKSILDILRRYKQERDLAQLLESLSL